MRILMMISILIKKFQIQITNKCVYNSISEDNFFNQLQIEFHSVVDKLGFMMIQHMNIMALLNDS